MSDEVDITLTLPGEMVEHMIAEAKALSSSVNGPEITTPQEAMRALLLYGMNTAALQRSLDERWQGHGERGGSTH